MLDLKYSILSRLCFWLLIIFSTVTVAFEYFAYAFEQLAEDKESKNASDNSLSGDGTREQHTGNAHYFSAAREFSELAATIACYLLLVLQFFMKKERKNK
jgi:hypothetical protein